MTGISAFSSVATAEPDLPVFADSFGQARARLTRHAAVWRERPLVRQVYRRYHEAILSARSSVEGVDLEIGAGHGSFAASCPGVVSCDLVPCAWLDCAADGQRLPFRSGSLSNLIMIDVLHHMPDLPRFFAEASRTLKVGGRILLIEPYSSPLSWIAWRFLHDERIDTHADPFAPPPPAERVRNKDPWEANIALPTLVFWRQLDIFHTRFPTLSVVRRDRFDLLLYPLSGGFERRRLIPRALVPAVQLVERLLTPLAPLLAFRCFVVIEKTRVD